MRRFLIITLTGAALATLAGPRGPLGGLWRPAPEAPHTHGALLGGFIAENMVENLAFGAGLAILLVGRTWFTARATTTGRATTAWLAAAWLLASWMPHAALHQHIGMHPAGMLPVEWIFHIGAILAAGALVLTLPTPSAADRASPDQRLFVAGHEVGDG